MRRRSTTQRCRGACPRRYSDQRSFSPTAWRGATRNGEIDTMTDASLPVDPSAGRHHRLPIFCLTTGRPPVAGRERRHRPLHPRLRSRRNHSDWSFPSRRQLERTRMVRRCRSADPRSNIQLQQRKGYGTGLAPNRATCRFHATTSPDGPTRNPMTGRRGLLTNCRIVGQRAVGDPDAIVSERVTP